MRCPRCESLEDRVIESRTLANGLAIRRRRECSHCSYRFTSYERIEEKPLMVVKNDGRREAFQREKLERGIQRAVEKRPVPQAAIEEMINGVEDEAAMEAKTSREISSNRIGKLVLDHLYSTDKVAYIRFASVYRRFENVDEFMNEISRLSKSSKKAAT